MAKGAVVKFADGSGLEQEGEPLEWIDLLSRISHSDFVFAPDAPFRNIMSEISPYEVARVVDAAIIKHGKSIRAKKQVERDTQALAVAAMVEQAYITGARELAAEGIRGGLVSPELALKIRERFDALYRQLWRNTASRAATILMRVRASVHNKGHKSRPLRLDAVNSARARSDDEILAYIARDAPLIPPHSIEEYQEFMLARIVPAVRQFMREGKLDILQDLSDMTVDHQYNVDAHAGRVRLRLNSHVAAWKAKTQ